MKKFLKDLEAKLRKIKINEEDLEEILADHEEMIESAIKEGLSDEELEAKFGDPEKLAEELAAFTSKKRDKEYEAGEEIVLKNVSDGFGVEIHLISEDIEVSSHDEDYIIVKPVNVRNINKYTIEVNDNTLLLEAPKLRGIRFGTSENRRFEIYLPKAFKVGNFHSKSISGDFEIEDLTIKEFFSENTSGDMDFENLKIGNFKVSVINGDIEIKNVECKEFVASMISGDADIDGLKCKDDIFINTISGDLEINNSSCNEAVLKTVSGDLDGEEFYPKVVSLKSVSGDITITNSDKERPIEIKRKRSVSGDVNIITN